jgi:hypothetical protein
MNPSLAASWRHDGYTYADGITFAQAQAYFDKTGNYASHTDVAVARRPNEADVIGANVLDSFQQPGDRARGDGMTRTGLSVDLGHWCLLHAPRLDAERIRRLQADAVGTGILCWSARFTPRLPSAGVAPVLPDVPAPCCAVFRTGNTLILRDYFLRTRRGGAPRIEKSRSLISRADSRTQMLTFQLA